LYSLCGRIALAEFFPGHCPVYTLGDILSSRASATTSAPTNNERTPSISQDTTPKENLLSVVGKDWLRGLLISVALLVPCFWHSRLLAGDLSSHVYNAWLVQLIERGQAPGLWIAAQWNNVLFDQVLGGLVRLFSFHAAEMIAASICVLIFFWGVFSFIQAATRRPPWFLVPILAVFAYGWSFQEGLFNYYLSLGLAFLALAVLWRGVGSQRLALVIIIPLTVMAHPLGFAWFTCGAAYIVLAERIPRRWHFLLAGAAVLVLAGTRAFLLHYFRVQASVHALSFYNGLDQMIFTNRYLIPAGALALLVGLAIAIDLLRRRGEPGLLTPFLVPFELYLITQAGVLLLPETVYSPHYAAPVSVLTERLTSISAVLLCCVVGAVTPRRWHLFAGSAIAATFFAFLYQDTANLLRMEQRVEQLVRSEPPGQRILVTIGPPLRYRFSTKHLVEEACLGYCFSYGNYEPPSTQFRVRARPGNHNVMTRIAQATAMERGEYIVQPDDLPASQIYQCGPAWTNLCIHPLAAGERNDRLGVHPERGIVPNTRATIRPQ
jgi:hypothetical protein